MHVRAFRLTPGADLRAELERLSAEPGLGAGFILTAVGSLSRARLRMPGEAGEVEAFLTLEEPMEIVCLSGPLPPEGVHLHIGLSRRDGACVGGHLVAGCIVRTTAEVVVGEPPGLAFRRRLDPETGYGELSVEALRAARPPRPHGRPRTGTSKPA